MATKKKSLPKAQTMGQTGSKFKKSTPGNTKRYPVTSGYNPFQTQSTGPINTSGPREINTQKKGGSVKSKSKKK